MIVTCGDLNINIFNVYMHAKTSPPKILIQFWPALGSINVKQSTK